MFFRIDNIRAMDENPGLRDFEANLLRLIERITNGTVVEIDETGVSQGSPPLALRSVHRRCHQSSSIRGRATGTRLKYKPGVVVGGADLVHDCGTGRAIGYYLEPLVLLSLFAKRARGVAAPQTAARRALC